jgi:hypothetical protein
MNHQIFGFLQNSKKIELLKQINSALNIDKSKLNKIIFIYSKPKVGSTSLVTSLRIFGSNKYIVIHIHDEEMLKVLINIKDITINEIILYNKYIGKDVYVIDIYRSPIEHKISIFFEKIDTYHFNNTCDNINKYNISRIISRFNKVFPFIGKGDHFLDIYPINTPSHFDFEKKYILIEQEGVKYIKLRLNDSKEWDNILTKLLDIRLKIIKDYETNDKPIKEIFSTFKEKYRIPENFLQEINDCKYLNFYFSKEEKNEYISKWNDKKDISFIPFTFMEYKLYQYISRENQFMNDIQLNHYLDEGCICVNCQQKRTIIANKLLSGQDLKERIVHSEIKNEALIKRLEKINKLNEIIKYNLNDKQNKKMGNMKKIVDIR